MTEPQGLDQGSPYVKVWFPLVQTDGWPPVSGENVWTTEEGSNRYEIANVPFFVRDIAVGDIVRAELDERGELQVQEKIQWAGSCTIRIVPLPDGGLEDQRQRILDMFAPLGLDGEGIAAFDLVALNVPDNVDYRPIKTLLRAGYDKGWWDCEEGCIGDRWAETEPQVRP